MSNLPKWIATPFLGIEFDNSVSEEFNTDNHPIAISLGNEDGQNKIDATLENKKGKIVVSYFKNKNSTFFSKYLNDLKYYLNKSEPGYDTSIDENNTDFLIIEDFNTYGLTGDLDSPKKGERYKHFFLSFSKSKSGTQLGRRGQGRNVYFIASRIRSFFGYSIQSDTKKKLLRGTCHAGQITIGDDNYNPYLSYTVPYDKNKNELQNQKETKPIIDEKIIDDFIKTCGVKRKNEAGLSIIIPYPLEKLKIKTLKNSYLKRFYAAILFNRLEFEIDNELIDEKNIKEQCKSIDIDPNYIDFIYDSKTLQDDQYNIIDFSNTNISEDILNPSIFNKEKIDELKKAYYSGKILSFKVFVTIPYKNSEEKKSFFNFHLNRATVENNLKRPALFMRGDLQLPEMSRKFKYSSKCFAFLWAEDTHMATFLGDSEGKAHLKWDMNHRDIEKNYKLEKAERIFVLINSCLNSIYKIITETDEEVDYDTFSSFIPKVESDENEEERIEKRLIDDFDVNKKGKLRRVTKKKRKNKSNAKKMVEDRKVNGGFIIVKMESTEKKEFPMVVRSTCAYNVRRGNPFNAYQAERHFVINQGSVKITREEKIKDLKVIDGNRIEFTALTDDFVVEVTGFDTDKKDIYVKTRKLKDPPELKAAKNG
jgi:hypothetical protein